MSVTFRVTGERAHAFWDFRDLSLDINAALAAEYRQQVVASPRAFDAPTIAIALRRNIRFADGLAPAVTIALAAGDVLPWDKLRGHVEATPQGIAVIAACEAQEHTSACADALIFLLIEERERWFTVEEHDALPEEDAPEGETLPEEAPPGYEVTR